MKPEAQPVKVDILGRIYLPSWLRKNEKIKQGQEFEVYRTDGGKIAIIGPKDEAKK